MSEQNVIIRPEAYRETIRVAFAIFAKGSSYQLPHIGHAEAREYAELCGQYEYYTKEYEWGKLVRERKYIKCGDIWLVKEEVEVKR